jgi:hypothetical protein
MPIIKTNADDVVTRLQNDLEIINQKLTVITGLKKGEAISSSFVSGIRRVTEERKYSDVESLEILPLLEKVLSKMNELDREILKKTNITGQILRRKSNGDLFCQPSYLTVTDRLLDLHTQSLRVGSNRNLLISGSVPDISKDLKVVPILSTMTSGSTAVEVELLKMEKGINSELQNRLETVMSQLNDSQKSEIKANLAMSESNDAIKSMQNELNETKKINEEFRKNLAQESSATSIIEANRKAGYESLNGQIVTLEGRNRMLEEQLEIEVASNQDAITAIKTAASNLKNNEDFLQIGSANLSKGISESLKELSNSLSYIIDSHKIEAEKVLNNHKIEAENILNNHKIEAENILNNHKIEAENILRINKELSSEISSLMLVKDTVHNDYMSLLSVHDILKSDNLNNIKKYDEMIENLKNEKNNEIRNSDKNNEKRNSDFNEKYTNLMEEFETFKEDTLNMVNNHQKIIDFYKIAINDNTVKNKDENEKNAVKDTEISLLKSSILKSEKDIADIKNMNSELKILNIELTNQIKLIPIPKPDDGKNIDVLENEISNLKFEIVQINLELQSSQKLIITLKDKIREMGGKDISFMDSFEEVSMYKRMNMCIH